MNKRQRKKAFKKLYGVAPELIWRRAFNAYLGGIKSAPRDAIAAGVHAGAHAMMQSLVQSVADAMVHRALDCLDIQTCMRFGALSAKHDNLPARADEMRPEYDLRGGVRGKYFERYYRGRATTELTSPLESFKMTSLC